MYVTAILVFVGFLTTLTANADDPYLWLEDVGGEKQLEWVEKVNEESLSQLQAVPEYKETYERILRVLDSKSRIPFAARLNEYYYNFWQDSKNPRGIYRRSTLEEYRKAEPKWELVLDIDELARKENENWVYKGMSHLYPNFDRGLVRLSRGGADAVVVREFDINTRSFVEGGFFLPEAKSSASWRDIDTLYVGTDFGPDSLSNSGYPRIVKLWKRGTALEDAQTIHTAGVDSMSATGRRLFSESGHLDLVFEATTFFSHDYYLLREGSWCKLEIPDHVDIVGHFHGDLLLKPRSDWTIGEKTFRAGSVLVGSSRSIGSGQPDLDLLIDPSQRLSVDAVDITRGAILITVLDNVAAKLFRFERDPAGKWSKSSVAVPENGSISVFNATEKHDDYFFTFTGYLAPPTLYLVHAEDNRIEPLKSQPAFFDPSPYHVLQLETESKDGTKVPYFLVKAQAARLDGNNPTLLYGYGGFEVSLTPSYSGTLGAWLEKGGIYVIANIRGGGEFGPNWHQAALKKNRHKAFEDFISVAEDLIRRKVTRPDRLAIQGGSNGGLLVGAVFVQRPDLFGAVVCQVPLLDMKRYSKLLAGASWVAEYGDPDDPDIWDYIKTYSPYHNLKKGINYPAVFLTTSTRDDRVHPGHARKMTAKMKEQGHRALYFENIEGGHGGAANNEQRARMTALGYAFLFDQLWPKAR